MFSKEELIKSLTVQNQITKAFADNNKFGFDLSLDEFMLHSFFLNPQRYGLRVQFYISHMMKYTPLSSSLDSGDFLNREGEEVEIKCSFLSETNQFINVKQIRQWQPIKYYYVFSVDFNDLNNLQYKCFKLSKDEMTVEMDLCNAKPVHSTKERNEENKHVEYGFSLKVGSENYIRWCNKYELKKFDLKQICEDRLKEENHKQELENTIKSLEMQLILNSEEQQEEIYIDDSLIEIREIFGIGSDEVIQKEYIYSDSAIAPINTFKQPEIQTSINPEEIRNKSLSPFERLRLSRKNN